MSNHQLSITAGQVGKFIQSMAEVGSENFQRQGVPLLHLLAEYLRQEKPRIPSLTAMRMVLGLPARPDLGVANVEWAKAVPPQRLSEFAVRPGGRKRAWTQVARLFPEDLGLVSGDVVPSQVLERALEWGFQLIPPEAFVVLTRNVFGGQVVPGDAMAYLDEKIEHRPRVVHLFNYVQGHGFREGVTMERRTSRDFPENWSILVASETIEAK